MTQLFSRISAASAALALSAAPLYAQGWAWSNWFRGPSGRSAEVEVTSVPEIDASAGLLAIAAVLAVMAFAWERRRRAA